MGKILAFSGSNSSQSINQQLIHSAAAMINDHEVEVISLIDYPAPVFGVDLKKEQGIPGTIHALNAKFEEADGLLISTPEHNGSMPAVFKNTIDWLSMIRPSIFGDKPTVFMSTSTGARGGRSVLDHVLTIMPYRGAKIVGSFSLPSFNTNFSDGIVSASQIDELRRTLLSLEKAVSDAVASKV